MITLFVMLYGCSVPFSLNRSMLSVVFPNKSPREAGLSMTTPAAALGWDKENAVCDCCEKDVLTADSNVVVMDCVEDGVHTQREYVCAECRREVCWAGWNDMTTGAVGCIGCVVCKCV